VKLHYAELFIDPPDPVGVYLASEVEALLPHKGNDLPEDVDSLLIRGDFGQDGEVCWVQADRHGAYFIHDGSPVLASRVTHWMRVPEVQP
jgi:hypothetical protein